MSRILIFVLAVWGLFWLLKRALGKLGDPPAGRPPATGADPAAAELVPCAHCGVLLPKGEALASPAAPGGESGTPQGRAPKYYCSEEHRRRSSG